MATISVQEYEKAITSLRESFEAFSVQNDLKLKAMLRDSVIQRFEFSCELAWKVSGKVLGLSSTAPKVMIREMAKASLISDVQLWFDFIEARNKSSHAYDEKIAIEVMAQIQGFLNQAQVLLVKLKQK